MKRSKKKLKYRMPTVDNIDERMFEHLAGTGPIELVCDFCSSPDVLYRAVCAPFDLEGVPGIPLQQHSIDDWAMCADCAILVTAGERKGLLKRANESFDGLYRGLLASDPALAGLRDDTLREAHEKFWKHYMGEIVEVSKADRELTKQHVKRSRAENRETLKGFFKNR
jgi:hypothetical protein